MEKSELLDNIMGLLDGEISNENLELFRTLIYAMIEEYEIKREIPDNSTLVKSIDNDYYKMGRMEALLKILLMYADGGLYIPKDITTSIKEMINP